MTVHSPLEPPKPSSNGGGSLSSAKSGGGYGVIRSYALSVLVVSSTVLNVGLSARTGLVRSDFLSREDRESVYRMIARPRLLLRSSSATSKGDNRFGSDTVLQLRLINVPL
jgi:hypothetical protein